MDPKGKIALVTGAAHGIGFQITKELLLQEVKGVSICDVNPTKGQEAAEELKKEFGEDTVLFIKTDVSIEDESNGAFEQTVKHFGGLDIVCNNAGIFNDRLWQHSISINVNGVIMGTILALKYLGKDQGGKGGVVINTGSIAGLGQALKITPVYNATKHAVLGFTRSFRSEFIWKTTGVRVMAVCPGYTTTEIIDTSIDTSKLLMQEKWQTEFSRELAAHPPPQNVENVGKAVLHMIREGKPGSLWVSESNEPVYEINIPTHENFKV
ncbi:hypothetical protein C0J52_07356 [Blattella germanica]|nr:hypothetical protein C0J52_07356 [Blattella germanica]